MSLKELQEIVTVKDVPPETTPSLREALSRPIETVGCYYFTPSLRTYAREVFDCAANRKGQGFWIQAEYGAGKTHFLAVATSLLTNPIQGIWDAVHDEELRQHYRAALSKRSSFR